MKNKNVKKETLSMNPDRIRNHSKGPIFKSTTSTIHHKISPKKAIVSNEDTIEIKIPTPYPKSQYMLITDPTLINSPYTTLLNEKCPQRKYLRHNLTSWLRCNKNKGKDISVKIMNPEFKFKHESLNLKKLSYNNEEVNEYEINRLEDALEVIRKLKLKVLEYEETNNDNIESSLKIIDELKAENEFYKKKLLENYEMIDKYEEKYGDGAVLGEYTNSILGKFEKKCAMKKIFSILKNNLRKKNVFREKHKNFQRNVEFVLKIKSFLSLQKNVMIEKFSHKLQMKRLFILFKNGFYSLKTNLNLNRLSHKYNQIKRTIRLIYYFKILRINIGNKKVNTIFSKKGLSFYFSRKKRTIFDVLKYNVYFNKEKGISRQITVNVTKSPKQNGVGFMNFLKDTNCLDAEPEIKEKKFKALKVFRQLYDVNKALNKNLTERNQFFSNNRKKILIFYIKLWKSVSGNCYNVASFSEKVKLYYYSTFIHNCKENSRFKSLMNNHKYFCLKLFFKKIQKKKDIKKKKEYFINNTKIKNRKIVMKLLKKRTESNIYSKFKRMSKIIRMQSFFERIKKQLYLKRVDLNNKGKIEKLTSYFLSTNTIHLFKKKFLQPLKRIIITNKKITLFSIRFKYINTIKYFNYLRTKTLKKILVKLKENLNKITYDMKTIMNEKNERITEIENENTELSIRLNNALETMKQDQSENEEQRKTILALENKISENTKKFNELWTQNIKDIKNLEETLKNNEKILNNAISREEHMQNKYCADINNAINLNKQLNSIINKKNLQINELKSKIVSTEKCSIEVKKKLINENADLYNNFSEIFSKKNNKIKQIKQEKEKIFSEAKLIIDNLEEQKTKHEFKANLLEDENKIMFNQYIDAIKKTSKN